MPASPIKGPGTGPPRPSKLQTSKSFARLEPSPSESPHRNRASTLSNEVLQHTGELSEASPQSSTRAFADSPRDGAGSIFEKPGDEEGVDTPRDSTVNSPTDLPPDFDELPIEIATWIDRFVNELKGAKVFPQPPSADRLSEIFQDFYLKAEQKINMHIKHLASRQSRAASPASSLRSARPRPSPRLASVASRDSLRRADTAGGAQPMLTPTEVHEKRRARRLLEYKRGALEEAVERRLCDSLYDKLWRHKSTLDEVRDEKLRGKTGSLQLVGIGLKELGVDLISGDGADDSMTSAERAATVEEWISKAAEGLLNMNSPHNPKGKLDYLISAHQKIVDLLTKIHKGSSSADEILPTLIYCLLTSPADGLNIISNMMFIQRFRCANKMNGEAAYCLTNLEAAITFLETVDLASLRSEEAIADRPETPLTATFAPTQTSGGPSSAATTATSRLTVTKEDPAPSKAGSSQPVSRPASHHRRISSLISVPANAFNTANDAVRNTAEESFKSVSTTLDSSFKFLFGRLKERQQEASDAEKNVVLPKTLDEARKLVTPKPTFEEDDNASDNSSFQGADDDHPLKEVDEDRLVGLIAGKPKGLGLSQSEGRVARVPAPQAGTSPNATPGNQALDSAAEAFRNFGSSINPLNRLSGAGFMRGFGRTVTPPSTECIVPPPPPDSRDSARAGNALHIEHGEITKLEPPPRQRFVDVQHASELKVGEIQDLLNEYHRLVGYLKGHLLV